jgi:hypothetical protein
MKIHEYESLRKIQDKLLVYQGREPTRRGDRSLKKINKKIKNF